MRVTTKKAAIEKQMAQLEKELKSIESSAAFKKENTVKRALTNLMKKHGYSKNDLIAYFKAMNQHLSKAAKSPPQRHASPESSKCSKIRKQVKPLKLAVAITKY